MSKWRAGQPRAARLALEFLAFAREVALQMARVQAPAADHLADAAASLLANIGEALEEESPGDMRRFLRYAKRSAGECERLLLGGAELGVVTPRQLEEGMRRLKDLKWDLRRLMAWTHRR